MIDRREHERIAALRTEIGILRLDDGDLMDSVLPEVRDLLQADLVMLYSVAEAVGGWELSRCQQAGGDPRLTTLFTQAVRTQASHSIFYYDVLWPAAAQRNRVVDATQWIMRHQPGTWEDSRMYREILQPVALHRHAQPRALLCDGPALLGWFGALHPESETRRQRRLLAALVPAMSKRLALERQLADAPRTSAALRIAIEQLGSAAFVLGPHGRIHETNAAGRALLDTDRTETTTALDDALAGRANPRAVELVPLQDRGVPTHFLAIVRGDPVEVRVAACVQLCVTRWSLTARQAEVLALVARGLANATIAAMMRVGERSIELHITAIFDRAGVDSRAALVACILTSN